MADAPSRGRSTRPRNRVAARNGDAFGGDAFGGDGAGGDSASGDAAGAGPSDPPPPSAAWTDRRRFEAINEARMTLFGELLSRLQTPLLAVLIGVALEQTSAAAPPRDEKRPNCLVIMVDDLGYGDLSCFGAEDVRTPNIDRLMEQGVRFTEFYANSCVCSPTRASLLTGRYPDRVGVPGVVRTRRKSNWGYLSPDAVMLPTLFQDAGYHTSLVGKWHLGLRPENHPNRRGFDAFKGFLGDMMDDYWDHRRHGVNYMRDGHKEIDPAGHATDLFTGWSIDFLRAAAERRQPFFHYLAYNAPHDPIQPPADWLARHRRREPEARPERARIAAFIEHLDHGVGRVLAALEESGAAGNTVVVFTSDNGGALKHAASNGALRGGKTQMYEGGLKVGTCVRWPGATPGRTTNFRALTMDLLPTLADICGVAVTHEIDGRSFKRELTHGNQSPFDRAVFHTWLQKKTKSAVRRGDWKLVDDKARQDYELFNLATDPNEQADLAEQQQERVLSMALSLKQHRRRTKGVRWQRPADE